MQASDEVLGPMSASDLRVLARFRRISADTFVSTDKIRWMPASKLKGLFDQTSGDSSADSVYSLEVAVQTNAASQQNTAKPTIRPDSGSTFVRVDQRERPAATHKISRQVEFAPPFPVLRFWSSLLRHQAIAIYDTHIFRAKRFGRKFALTEKMCHVHGESELRAPFGRVREINFDEVREVREITASRRFCRYGGMCHFVVRSDRGRRIRFKLPATQASSPRDALSVQLGDRYLVRESRWWQRSVGMIMLSIGVIACLFGINLLSSSNVPEGAIGAVVTAFGGMLAGWGFYVALPLGTWIKFADYEFPDPKAVKRPKKAAKAGRPPYRSKPLGWAVKVIGLVYYVAMAGPISNVLPDVPAAQFWVLMYAPAPMLIYYGYRMCQRSYDPNDRSDRRKPILFLRPFEDDLSVSLQPTGFFSGLTGLRVEGLTSGVYVKKNSPGALLGEAMFNCYPVRLLRLFLNLGTDSAEESLSRVFERYGRVIAIGKPGDAFAAPGAARVYLQHEEWQEVVLAELRRAEIVVLQPGATEGVRWEFEQIRTLDPPISPRRLLLCLASYFRNPQSYEEMARLVREELLIDLPRIVPFLERCAFVHFRDDWSPQTLELSNKCPALWPILGDATDLDYTLQPFLEGLRSDSEISSPRPPRWVKGFLTWGALCLAAVLSILMYIIPVSVIQYVTDLFR